MKVVSEVLQDMKLVNNEVLTFPIKYEQESVSGSFSFVKSNQCRRHAILMASRFNQHSKEENGPFPGWFVQIVGNKLSLAIGTGKKWLSTISDVIIENGVEYKVVFCVNNITKNVQLYVNDTVNVTENVKFRVPCKLLTVNALNRKGEFKFTGEIKNFVLGYELSERENELSTREIVDISSTNLKEIEISLVNLDKDIGNLKDIRAQIVTWKYRGLDIDVDIVSKQIEKFEIKRKEFVESITDMMKVIVNIADRIVSEEEVENVTHNNIIKIYTQCLNNLVSDLDVLLNVKEELSKFDTIGVKLGDAFSVIDEQIKLISDTVAASNTQLEEKKNYIAEIINIITIDE